MIGVGLIGFITILASSTRASVYDAIDEAFTGDFVVVPGVAGFGGFDPTLTARLADVPSVEAATGVRTGAASLDGATQELAAFDPDSVPGSSTFSRSRGSLADLDEDGIAVFRDVADENRLEVGDRIPVVFTDTGRRELTVAVIYAEDQMAGDYFIGIDAYEANFKHQLDSQVLIETTDGVTTEAQAAIEQITDAHPGAKVLDEAGFKADQTRFLGRMLGLIYALLGLAILIAILGITNTLALSVLDRTRELGLLAPSARHEPSCGPPFDGSRCSWLCKEPCSDSSSACCSGGRSSRHCTTKESAASTSQSFTSPSSPAWLGWPASSLLSYLRGEPRGSTSSTPS